MASWVLRRAGEEGLGEGVGGRGGRGGDGSGLGGDGWRLLGGGWDMQRLHKAGVSPMATCRKIVEISLQG